MTLNNKYKITWSPSARDELINIHYYISHKFKETKTANTIVSNILASISNLQYSPERFIKLFTNTNKSNNLRRLIVNNYIIIFEVKTNTHQVFILHIFHSSEDYITKL